MFKNTGHRSGSGYGGYDGGMVQRSPYKAPLKGLFTDGVWMFYKCQKPQIKQCNFFLWESEAKLREEGVVGGSSRSEPAPPKTPTTSSSRNNPYNTPTSNIRQPQTPSTQFNTPSKPPRFPAPAPTTTTTSLASKQTLQSWSDDEDGREEFFDWPHSDEEAEVLPGQKEDQAEQRTAINPTTPEPNPPPATRPMPPPQTPRKTPRTTTTTSPSKRARSTTPPTFPTPTTPPTSRTLFALPSPPPLATEILTLLQTQSITLPPPATAALTHLCNTHTLRAQGLARGRDVSRDALREKERLVRELRQRVLELEAERERDRVVIGSLRRERLGRVGMAWEGESGGEDGV
ncbi:MAG: hypothetical protein M1839_001369 [Geoglossum umbratile]|nr:MAG: hypothetical protein M1839_001369 [Geoglossum umbratile]